ncbi:hypothetical protein KBZ12_06290 [Cyanobium sp. Cruz CV13-4-11]|uniref:hypothetical protein n=1 Tax=Cyanobium sp. Cruz CV11-17 TaxID=2823709 RepID=UPI0020CBBCC4|nr:hypothetical protein [Cyanobium sp. Cruz CV11-17]MCP9900928.1 hypothetical protein [Cyanobium sp. Cruz CV11-17]MCP9919094.1 hypothetical protein [Cyanobium sp. Cruz CV13-4-11]
MPAAAGVDGEAVVAVPGPVVAGRGPVVAPGPSVVSRDPVVPVASTVARPDPLVVGAAVLPAGWVVPRWLGPWRDLVGLGQRV